MRKVMKGGLWRVLAFGLIACLGLAAARAIAAEAAQSSAASPTYLGSSACASCHPAQSKMWASSHHARAMAPASETTVLGDFNDVKVEHFGVRSRFFRDGAKFMVETDGADGKLSSFEIKYTFGVEPLQQYLVEFPDGRRQTLPFAWDSRPAEAGGQRWFHIYPDERIAADDELHWTKLSQNWNFMCAGCHSTNLQKNYDAARDSYRTTYSEISVGCESCHGPASRHVAWAKGQAPAAADKGLEVIFDDRARSAWTREAGASSPHRAAPASALRKEVETCGLCHARAAQLREDWTPGQDLSNTHLVTPITRGLFAADGQMIDREETYNYVPFKQSRMFAAGVTCADCHDPHSAKLRLPRTETCLACHAPELATTVHSHHADGPKAPDCAACHMPSRLYMVVDVRHDHSFRIPRPDLSVRLGTPNACNDCHRDKSAAWAAAAVETWYGPQRKGFQTYGPAFHAAWSDDADAQALLIEAARLDASPSVARAGELAALAAHPSAPTIATALKALADADPMVRIGALEALASAPTNQIRRPALPLLNDPILAVRLRALWLLAATPDADMTAEERDAFARAAAEFEAAQRYNADRPEARSTLAGFYALRGRPDDAQREFEAALKLNPAFSPAALGLADLFHRRGDDAKSIDLLRGAAAKGGDAAVHHALGLALVRAKKYDEALDDLARATKLAPDNARFAYVYAVALHSLRQPDKAMAELERALALRPRDRTLLAAALSFSREAGNDAATLAYAERLSALAPDDQDLAAFVRRLRQRIK